MRRAGYNPTQNEVLDIINRFTLRQSKQNKKDVTAKKLRSRQGGRTWQPFVGGKNVHENFRQTRSYNFRAKCVVFARNRKFAKLTQ